MGLRHISAAANHLVDHSQSLCKLINTVYVPHTHWHTHTISRLYQCTYLTPFCMHVHLVSEPIGSLSKERDVKKITHIVNCIFAHSVQCMCCSKTAISPSTNVSAGNSSFLFHLILFLVRYLRLYRQG